MTGFLNGIEIIEVDTGGRTITTPSTSVIGLVGTMYGVDVEEKFPLNTPVLVTKIQDIEGMDSGTIPASLRGIYNQVSAICVVVRIIDGEDITETITNASGDIVSYNGVYALMLAEAKLKVRPKILLCPYLSSILTDDDKPNSIVNNLIDIADKLRAVAIIDGTNTTRQDVIDFASNISSSRAYIIDPTYKPTFNYTPATVSSSSLVAGVIAKNDNEKGFWCSPSNTEVKGIVGLSRPISFALSDPTTDSNLMNENGVGTIIFSGGCYRIWGNRSPSQDSKWHYISVRRTVDTVYDAIDSSMLWALGRPFSKQLFSDIQNNVQTYINTLISQGALLGGTCWVDMDANTQESYSSGQLLVDFDLLPPNPLERLTFRASLNQSYVEELFK
jgi:phage tail sheath protein FI